MNWDSQHCQVHADIWSCNIKSELHVCTVHLRPIMKNRTSNWDKSQKSPL